MSWDTGGNGNWDAGAAAGADSWNGGGSGDAGAAGDSWGSGGDTGGGDAGGGDAGDQACRICSQTGHFARDCPDKPPGGGLTGECFNCGEVGHNKADCPNPKVDRPFTGTCNLCQQEGHAARDCPNQKCRLCDQPGHKAMDCTSRRRVDWTGIPEMEPEEAWKQLIDAASVKDIDTFRTCLRAYARAVEDEFSLPDVEGALRKDNIPVYLIAKQQEIAPNMVIVDLIGNPNREFVLTFQLSPKARRPKFAQGWPESPEENLKRLASAGIVQDRGVPMCSNCGELGHVKKHCKQEMVEHESNQPTITCVNCHEVGHRARDCPKERFNPYACKNCKQEGHNAKECPEPRSAEGVECRKCNQMGHFSKDCPNVEKKSCHNCGSTEHMSKECDQPRNPENTVCRNCEKKGHFSRECPEPKDWSKVKCSNCGEMGHTIKRCKQPVTEGDSAGDGGAVQGAGGWDTSGNAAAGGDTSWNDNAGGSGGGDGAGAGESSWDTGGAAW